MSRRLSTKFRTHTRSPLDMSRFRTVSTRHLDHQGWDSTASWWLLQPLSSLFSNRSLSLSACSSSSDDCHSWIIFYGPLSSCIGGFKRQKERGGGRMHGRMGRQEEWAAGSTQCSGQWADVFHYRVLLSIQVWWRLWYHTNDTGYRSMPQYYHARLREVTPGSSGARTLWLCTKCVAVFTELHFANSATMFGREKKHPGCRLRLKHLCSCKPTRNNTVTAEPLLASQWTDVHSWDWTHTVLEKESVEKWHELP